MCVTFGLTLVAIVAAIACGFLWMRAREMTRRAAEGLLPSLSASAALCDELARVLGHGADLLGHASISFEPPGAIAAQTIELHAGLVATQARVAEQAAASRVALTDAGIDLSPVLQGLGEVNTVVKEFHDTARRDGEARMSEPSRASARYAAAKLSEMAQLARQMESDVRRRETTLRHSSADTRILFPRLSTGGAAAGR